MHVEGLRISKRSPRKKPEGSEETEALVKEALKTYSLKVPNHKYFFAFAIFVAGWLI